MDNILQIVKEHLPQAGTELSIYTFCAANFPAFMEIMNLYMEAERRLAALEPTVDTDVFEKECEQAEAELRREVDKIDSTAIEDSEGLWSTMIEEMGAGIC